METRFRFNWRWLGERRRLQHGKLSHRSSPAFTCVQTIWLRARSDHDGSDFPATCPGLGPLSHSLYYSARFRTRPHEWPVHSNHRKTLAMTFGSKQALLGVCFVGLLAGPLAF